MKPDLRTHYLGFELATPLVASASPMTGRLETLGMLEEAGVSAVVLPSLFEEQIEHEEMAVHRLHEYGTQSFAEALDYLPELETYNLGPDEYLRVVRGAKESLSIPVIGSLNGSSQGGWVRHAKLIQDAGADALELNVYIVPSDLDRSGEEVERAYLSLVADVREAVTIPFAVKVGPSFSSPGNMARRLIEAGADGLVLFNRFLRPDIDLETLELVPRLVLSRSYDSRIAMQWIGILRGRIEASLAATGGVHDAEDALKLLLAGADVVMVASALLRNGPGLARELVTGISDWMEEREYASVEQMKGSMSQLNCPDPTAYERANYMKALISYSGPYV
jgi:dihydroorotate dehydrogenase (fumarate)